MKQYDAIETNIVGVFEVWQVDTDTGEKNLVDAYIDRLFDETGPEFYVKEGPTDGDYWNAKFLSGRLSTLGAALIRVECLVKAGMVGLYHD